MSPSTTSTIMPTASSRNGSGPTASHPTSTPEPRAEAAPVQKGGPFELAEIERLANEMFRALPSAFLPGLAPEELEAVRLDAESAALRPPAVTPPAVNGQVREAETTLRGNG